MLAKLESDTGVSKPNTLINPFPSVLLIIDYLLIGIIFQYKADVGYSVIAQSQEE
jgi:hypothetical protein